MPSLNKPAASAGSGTRSTAEPLQKSKPCCSFSARGPGIRLLFLAFWVLPRVSLPGQDYPFMAFSTRQGLPCNRVTDGLQDLQGHIWLATEAGASRFDGQDFRNFSQADGLTDDGVTHLFQDRRGRIWLFLGNGEVNLIDKERVYNRFSMPVLAGLQSRSGFNGFAEDGNGNFWFSTPADGVFVLNARNRVNILRPKTELPASLLAPGMWTGPDNQVRIGSDAGILNLSSKPMAPEWSFSPPGGNPGFLTATRAGMLLMSAAGKLWICRPPDRNFQPVPAGDVPLQEGATHIREDPEGGFWISTPEKILHIESPGFGPLTCRTLFEGRNAGPVFFDRQANPWICTRDEGVLLVTSRNELRFGREHGLPGTPIVRLGRGPSRIWAGSSSGDAGYIYRNRYHPVFSGLPSGPGPARGFYFRKETGQILMVAENALIQFEAGASPVVFPGDFRALGRDGAGNFIAGTRNNARFLNLPAQGKGHAVTGPEPLLPPCRVNAIETESDGSPWFATSSGLFTRQSGRAIYLKDRFPELGNSMQHLLTLGQNRVIAASSGNGIYFFQGDKLEKAGLAEGLPSLWFRSLRQAGKDSVLVCTARGVSLLTFHNGSSFLHIRNLNPGRFPAGTEVFDALVTGDTLVLATSAGISLFPRFLQPEMPREEKTRIGLIGTEGGKLRPFTGPDRISLRPGDRLRLILENYDFPNYGRLQFRYRLLPDTIWTESSRRSILATIPGTGDYQLEIQSRAGAGRAWEPVATPLPIQATGPLFRNLFFWIAAAIGVAGLYLFLRRRKNIPAIAGNRRQAKNPKPIRHQPLYQALPLLKTWLHFLAGRLADGDAAAALNLLHKIRHFYNLLDRDKAVPTLLDELRLLQRFLEAENLCRGIGLEFRFPQGADAHSAANTPFPPFLIVNLCRAALFLTGSAAKGEMFPGIEISLVRMGGVFQFTAEVLSGPEKRIWPRPLLQYFAGLTHDIRLQAEGHGRRESRLEIFYPQIHENRLTGSRFQIWIPVQGSAVSS